jgi:hypothetical protein
MRRALGSILGASVVVAAACDGSIQLGRPGDVGSAPPPSNLDGSSEGGPPPSAGTNYDLGSCSADPECAFDDHHCDLARSACVQCRDDSDCSSGESRHCERSAGRCVVCLSDADCDISRRCTIAHTCAQRCSATEPCSAGTCDEATGRCAECTPGTACGAGKYCASDATCVDCTNDTHCTGDEPRCDALRARCVKCTSDADCVAPKRCNVRAGECKTVD